jgi:hypothetical protein
VQSCNSSSGGGKGLPKEAEVAFRDGGLFPLFISHSGRKAAVWYWGTVQDNPTAEWVT